MKLLYESSLRDIKLSTLSKTWSLNDARIFSRLSGTFDSGDSLILVQLLISGTYSSVFELLC